MEFSSQVIYGAIALFSFVYLFWFRSSKPKTSMPLPPKAGGARPFTGHLHLMSGGSSIDKLPHIKLSALADKHGPAFTIQLGVRQALVVSSWELVKEIFTTNDVAVSSRPRIKAAKHLGHDSAMFGFSPYDSYWRELRKLISVELLSTRRIELQKSMRVSEIEQSVKDLYHLWEQKKDENSGKVLVELKKWLGDLNLNVVVRSVAGKRFSGGGDDAEETGRWQEVMREFFHYAGMLVPGDVFPYLGWLDLGGYERKMKETAKELDSIIGGWLSEHRQKENSGHESNDPQDFMDVMLSVVPGANFQGRFEDDTIIKATCESLISSATDTITIMLVWTLSLLLNNPRCLKKAQEELDERVGRNRRVNESDLNKLVYLQAITKETLRLYTASPLGGPREFTKDCTVGGYYIPKGTWLMINMWKLHRDPKVWHEDPLEFRPERFLDSHKEIDVKGQDFELIPFGAGRRVCPGMNFGLQMMHSVLANVLQAFELSTVASEKVDMSESVGMTNMKATPLDVLVAPRLSPDLY